MKEIWVLKQYDDNTEEVYLSNNEKELHIKNNHRFFQLAQKALDYAHFDEFKDNNQVYLTFNSEEELIDYEFKSESLFSMHGMMPTYEEDHIQEVKEKVIFPKLNSDHYDFETYLHHYGFDENLVYQMDHQYRKFKEKYEAEYQEKLQSGQLEEIMMNI